MSWDDNFYQDIIPVQTKLRYLNIDFKGKTVIDLGCNIGGVADYVFKRGAKSYKGIDNNEDYINEAVKRNTNENALFIIENITEMQCIKSGIVFALGLFHHLNDEDLKKVISVIDCDTLILEIPMENKHQKYHIRSVEEYKKLLSGFGQLLSIVKSGFITPPVLRQILIFERK